MNDFVLSGPQILIISLQLLVLFVLTAMIMLMVRLARGEAAAGRVSGEHRTRSHRLADGLEKIDQRMQRIEEMLERTGRVQSHRFRMLEPAGQGLAALHEPAGDR